MQRGQGRLQKASGNQIELSENSAPFDAWNNHNYSWSDCRVPRTMLSSLHMFHSLCSTRASNTAVLPTAGSLTSIQNSFLFNKYLPNTWKVSIIISLSQWRTEVERDEVTCQSHRDRVGTRTQILETWSSHSTIPLHWNPWAVKGWTPIPTACSLESMPGQTYSGLWKIKSEEVSAIPAPF